MTERTEEQIVNQAVIKVILGCETHYVKPLVIRESREWRKKVVDLISPLPQLVGSELNVDNPEAFKKILEEFLINMPDQVAELFFAYAKDLDREEIENKATDAELAYAFQQVIAVAFPLSESLPKVITRLSQ